MCEDGLESVLRYIRACGFIQITMESALLYRSRIQRQFINNSYSSIGPENEINNKKPIESTDTVDLHSKNMCAAKIRKLVEELLLLFNGVRDTKTRNHQYHTHKSSRDWVNSLSHTEDFPEFCKKSKWLLKRIIKKNGKKCLNSLFEAGIYE